MRPIRGSNGIPVGKDGKVPFKAIVRRFHEVGSRRDADSTDSVVLPRELTPSQIREWWDDPSVCDIEGVDTEDSDIYSVPISIRGKKRAALSKIAVLADRKESARIKKVLADSFTADELELMASGIPLMVSSEEHLRDCTGFYLRRQEGITVPIIPGIKPITNQKQLVSIPRSFHCDLPEELTNRMMAAKTKEEQFEVGVDWAVGQCRDLINHGVPGLHFYTTSQAKSVAAVAEKVF